MLFRPLGTQVSQQSEDNSSLPLLTDEKLSNITYLVTFSLSLDILIVTTRTKIEIGPSKTIQYNTIQYNTVLPHFQVVLKLLETDVFTNLFPLQIFLLMKD